MPSAERAPISLVTGGGRGIGYEVVAQLAGAGHRVLLGARDRDAGRRAAARLRAEGGDVECVELEVTDARSVARAARHVEQRHGVLDVLVNNAGILLEKDELPSETPLDLVRSTFETNVFAVMSVTNAMLPLLRRSPAARVVNLASQLGSLTLTGDPSGIYCRDPKLGYSPSKSALHSLTVMYANEFRHTTMKFNGADPGWCATDINGYTGSRTPRQGAAVVVALATLGADGPTGGCFSDGGVVLPW
ncbi:SDR family NAD(P)-dependent oxidoreductase [Actinoplanes sp. NPDC026670]|uniref:SDR family NAD(P)-dependent oxidoreductase n=1 Tax=Actinoplanes sp. NPDC026670 TaxID=3154700 RepID=UPI0033F20731